MHRGTGTCTNNLLKSARDADHTQKCLCNREILLTVKCLNKTGDHKSRQEHLQVQNSHEAAESRMSEEKTKQTSITSVQHKQIQEH